MTAKDAIKSSLDSNYSMFKMFIGDLSDADLLARPVPGANHAAWQIGHLIASQVQMLKEVPGAAPIPLPAGFAEKHAKATSTSDSPADFLKKAEYLEIFDKVHAATLALIDQLPDAQLDQPTTGAMKDFAPTFGHLLLLNGTHIMMHAGQFTVLRRKLGKPVLM